MKMERRDFQRSKRCVPLTEVYHTASFSTARISTFARNAPGVWRNAALGIQLLFDFIMQPMQPIALQLWVDQLDAAE